MDNYLFKLSRKLIITFSLLIGLSCFTSAAQAEKREISSQISSKPMEVAYRHYRYYQPYRPYRYNGYNRYHGPRYYHPYNRRYW